MKPSKVYREAARIIAEEETEFSCRAIDKAALLSDDPYEASLLAGNYLRLYQGDDNPYGMIINSLPKNWNQARNIRILLLLFAAEILG